MVAFESALRLHQNDVEILTVCPAGSPLQNKLVSRGLKTMGLESGSKYFRPSAILKLRRALREGAYSTVLVQQLRDLWIAVPAMLGLKGLKLVGISHTFVGVKKRDPLHGWLYRRLDQLIVLTETHKRNLLDHLPIEDRQLTILPNSVDVERFSPSKVQVDFRDQYAPRPETLLIGVVSRLDRGKGLVEVVEVADLLRVGGVDFKIVFVGEETVGEPGHRATLQDMIDQRGLRQHVAFAGHRSDIEAVMASLDVLLMPSPAETFGRVLIEAMASGTAVVATSGGGVADIIENEINGLLVPPKDPPAMAQALRRLQDAEFRTQLSQQALEKCHRIYDHRKVDRDFYRVLEIS